MTLEELEIEYNTLKYKYELLKKREIKCNSDKERLKKTISKLRAEKKQLLKTFPIKGISKKEFGMNHIKNVMELISCSDYTFNQMKQLGKGQDKCFQKSCVIYIAHTQLGINKSELARIFERDHATIINSIKNIHGVLSVSKKNSYESCKYNEILSKYNNHASITK